jgi:serine/threonine protein kinase
LIGVKLDLGRTLLARYTAHMADERSITPGMRMGPYEITGRLDSGGMGDVYRARDPRIGREVAVKVLRDSGNPDRARLQRFEDEARAAGALGHPNILVVYDVGRHGETPYLVSELLEGHTLRDVLLEMVTVPVRKALEWSMQIAQGLAAAHDKGLVHRDLKPKNLFITRDGRVKILDFGLAKLVQPARDNEVTVTMAERTETGVVLGTVGYMAPEQVRGLPVDPRADIFALGIVMQEMLSGAAPFARDTTAETLTAILKEDPPALPASVPPAIDRVVRRCLEKRPDDRFRSAHDLSLALEALSGGTGVIADPPAAPVTSRISRRQLLATGTVLGLGAGLGAGALLWRSERPAALPLYQRLTYRRGVIRTARFAPDYQTVYYGALWDGDMCRVYTARPETPESAPLQNLPPATPLAVSSSGELALSLGTNFRGAMPYGTLARVALTGGAPRELSERVKYADFSPDGRDLAVVRLVDGVERLEYPLGNVIAEPSVPGGGFSFPRVSRDGNRVACFELPAANFLNGTVVVVDREGNKRVASPRYFNCFGLAWGGDDDIWFTAAGDRPLFRDAIYAIRGDSEPRQLARLPGNASLHDVAPDGRVIMARTDDRGGIAALSPGDTVERDLSWLDLPIPADISTDGSILFWEAGVGGGAQGSVYIRHASASSAVRLGDRRAVALSPDRQWALATDSSAFPGAAYLDLLPVGPAPARRIERPGVTYWNARWVPVGKRLVVLAQEARQRPRLYELSLENGTMRPFTPEGVGFSWAVSPDGTRAAVVIGATIEIHFLNGNQPPQRVTSVSGSTSLVTWIERGLLVQEGSEALAILRIFLVDPQTGARSLWKELLPRDTGGIMNVGALVVTPDGRSYAYWWARALSDLYLGSLLG